MDKINLLFVNGGTMDFGGISMFIYNHCLAIDKDKFNVTVAVHGENEGPRDQDLLKEGIAIVRLPLKSKHPIKYKQSLSKLMSQKFDIVHSNCDSGNYTILKAAKKAGISHRISHSHNTDFLTKNTIKLKFHKMMRNRISNYATLYLACSNAAGIWLHQNNKFQVIDNSIFVSKFLYNENTRQKLREEMGITDCIIIGNIGKFDYQKNHPFMLKLMKKIKESEENTNIKLILIGDGPDRNQIEQYIYNNDLVDNIILLGNINNVYEYYNVFDLFILTSYFEGLPVVGIEAQINGLPCLFSETITKDLSIIDKCEYLPIDDNSLNLWINKINSKSREKRIIYRDSRYDIKSGIQELEALYCKLFGDQYES